MATALNKQKIREIEYPDSDGKPVGETPVHVKNTLWRAFELDEWFKNDPMVYVAENMFVYFEEGDPRRHVSPDVFVVHGVPKGAVRDRRKYLLWEEGKAPNFVIEFTSKSTRKEDMNKKMDIYRDILKVKEYFLFDPYQEFLDPRLQGFRLSRGQYVPIKEVDGRFPSEQTGLHLEGDDWQLRLYDPATDKWLPTPYELPNILQNAEQEIQQTERRLLEVELERQHAERERQHAETARQQSDQARMLAEAENERLRLELEEIKRRVKE
jgi:Uma2 family endonuclease